MKKKTYLLEYFFFQINKKYKKRKTNFLESLFSLEISST